MLSFATRNILSALKNMIRIEKISITIDDKRKNLDIEVWLIHYEIKKSTLIKRTSETY